MYDPRDEIKNVLNAWKPSGQDTTGIIFKTDRGDEWKVDVHLWEGQETQFEEGGKLGFSNPMMILLSNISSVSRNVCIGGSCRSHVALIDAHIFLVKDDRWNIERIRQEVSDAVELCIRTNAKLITGCIFCECINARDLDPLKQTLGVRRIIGIRATGNYDKV